MSSEEGLEILRNNFCYFKDMKLSMRLENRRKLAILSRFALSMIFFTCEIRGLSSSSIFIVIFFG